MITTITERDAILNWWDDSLRAEFLRIDSMHLEVICSAHLGHAYDADCVKSRIAWRMDDYLTAEERDQYAARRPSLYWAAEWDALA